MTGDREDVNRLVSRVVGILVAHLGPDDDDELLDGGYWGAAEDIVAAIAAEQWEA